MNNNDQSGTGLQNRQTQNVKCGLHSELTLGSFLLQKSCCRVDQMEARLRFFYYSQRSNCLIIMKNLFQDIVLFSVFFNFVSAVLQDERYIRQYREETDKMRNQIKELKTRCEWLVLHGHLHNIHLTVICRRSCSHFVFCFLPEKLLYNIYIIPKRQTAVTSTIGLCQSNPNQSFPLSVCLPVCLSVCPSVLPRICVFSFV